MKQLNVYFFGEEQAHWEDMVWFYGVGFIVPLVFVAFVFNG